MRYFFSTGLSRSLHALRCRFFEDFCDRFLDAARTRLGLFRVLDCKHVFLAVRVAHCVERFAGPIGLLESAREVRRDLHAALFIVVLDDERCFAAGIQVAASLAHLAVHAEEVLATHYADRRAKREAVDRALDRDASLPA